jgi:hypothetical protein
MNYELQNRVTEISVTLGDVILSPSLVILSAAKDLLYSPSARHSRCFAALSITGALSSNPLALIEEKR